jgi:predicted GNAT family acetyltransferase
VWYKFSQNIGNEDIKIFSDGLASKYKSRVRLYLTGNNDLRIDDLVVPKESRNQGVGSAIMREIVDFADRNNLRLVLTTGVKDKHNGTTSSGRLKKFYKRFDFSENKGKDYSISDNMLRNPKNKYASDNNSNELVRRFHYTDSDETLEKIAKEGIRVEKSQSWKYGDPKAIWSNDYYIERKPVIEFLEDPKNIIGNQYQFVDVPPERIIGVYKSWYPDLDWVIKSYGVEGGIAAIHDREVSDLYPFNLILEELNQMLFSGSSVKTSPNES